MYLRQAFLFMVPQRGESSNFERSQTSPTPAELQLSRLATSTYIWLPLRRVARERVSAIQGLKYSVLALQSASLLGEVTGMVLGPWSLAMPVTCRIQHCP